MKSLKKLLQQYLEQKGFTQQVQLQHLRQHWHKWAGNTIAKATKEIAIHHHRLIVILEDDHCAHDLIMVKDLLLQEINQHYGWKLKRLVIKVHQ